MRLYATQFSNLESPLFQALVLCKVNSLLSTFESNFKVDTLIDNKNR